MKKKVVKSWDDKVKVLSYFVPEKDAKTFLSGRKGSKIQAILTAYKSALPSRSFRRIEALVRALREGKPVNEKQIRNLAIKQWAKMDKKFRLAS